MTEEERHRFQYHRPRDDEEITFYLALRRSVAELIDTFDPSIPLSRERQRFIEKLEEAVMWGHAAVARYGIRPRG